MLGVHSDFSVLTQSQNHFKNDALKRVERHRTRASHKQKPFCTSKGNQSPLLNRRRQREACGYKAIKIVDEQHHAAYSIAFFSFGPVRAS